MRNFFHNIDKYFTPFIVPNKSRSLKTKELRDILPENNRGNEHSSPNTY